MSTRPPTISTLELAAIESLFEMGTGYVLDFSNRTFALFFADHGVDIDKDFPEGSKATRLRAFLRDAESHTVASVLEALIQRQSTLPKSQSSTSLARVKTVVARLRKIAVAIPEADGIEVISLAYCHELALKTDQRLAAGDFEGAITTSRTMLEAVLVELEWQLAATRSDHRGDLQRQFKAVAKQLRIDDDRADIDENFKQVVRGLVQIVNALAPIRNKMSDGHARQRKPAPHHARVISNAARTVATFLVESFLYQRERDLLPSVGRQ